MSRRVSDVPVKFQLCILKTVRMHVEFTFFEWLTLYFWTPRGTVESSTHIQHVPESHWRTCKDSTLYLKNCANACRIYVFWAINPLFLSPTRNRRIVNPTTTWSGESLTYLWSVNSVFWKLCEWTSNLRFFLVINPLFLSPTEYRRILNPSTTCPGE